MSEILKREMEKQNLNFLASIPEDPLIQEYDLNQRSLLDLPEDSSALGAVNTMVKELVGSRGE